MLISRSTRNSGTVETSRNIQFENWARRQLTFHKNVIKCTGFSYWMQFKKQGSNIMSIKQQCGDYSPVIVPNSKIVQFISTYSKTNLLIVSTSGETFSS